MKIACISLWRPKNQVDLDVMVHSLLSAGHRPWQTWQRQMQCW